MPKYRSHSLQNCITQNRNYIKNSLSTHFHRMGNLDHFLVLIVSGTDTGQYLIKEVSVGPTLTTNKI
jgi:hypothetical protein